jgi:hypothetical protein
MEYVRDSQSEAQDDTEDAEPGRTLVSAVVGAQHWTACAHADGESHERTTVHRSKSSVT